MGDGRDTPKPRDQRMLAAAAALKTMAEEGLCLSYSYETGSFYFTKGCLCPRRATPDAFDADTLSWLTERGLLADAGEPADEDECRYFLTAEGRRRGTALDQASASSGRQRRG